MMKSVRVTIVAALCALVAGSASAAQLTKKYTVTSAVGSGADHAIWISTGLGNGVGRDFDFAPAGVFSLYSDGTAKMSGHLVSQTNANAGFKLNFNWDNTFAGFTPKFKSENSSKEVLGQTFYRDLEGGTLSGTGILAGLELTVTRKPATGPYATQIGPSNGVNNGANNKNKNFGMATWFSINVTSANCSICDNNSVIANLNGRQGDINADLAVAPIPVPAAGFLLVGGLAALGGLRAKRRAKA